MFPQSTPDWARVLAEMTCQALVLAIVIWLILRVAGRWISPAWRFALWSLVGVRLCLPVVPESEVSLFALAPNLNAAAWSAPEDPADVDDPANSAIHSSGARVKPLVNLLPSADGAIAVPSTNRQTEELRRPPGSSTADKAADSDPQAAATLGALSGVDPPISDIPNEQSSAFSKPIRSTAIPFGLILAVWLGVVALILSRQFLQHRRLSKIAARWTACDCREFIALLAECRAASGVRRSVRLLVSHDETGPATIGILRPQIIVPASIVRDRNSRNRRLVIQHELAHIRRLDVLWDRLISVIAAVHWFNPAAWIARGQLRRERELACDAAVLRGASGEQAHRYGRLIVALAQRTNPLPASLPTIARSHTRHQHNRQLSRRIHMIANETHASRVSSWLGGALLVAIAVTGLTAAEETSKQQTEESDNGNRAVASVGQDANNQDARTDYVVSGKCLDESGEPVSGVTLRVFRYAHSTGERTLLATGTSIESGDFRFENLPAHEYVDNSSVTGKRYRDTSDALAISKSGFASRLLPWYSGAGVDQPTEYLEVQLLPAGTLKGRITDEEGNPIAGADVFTVDFARGKPIEGINSAKSDANGYYEIKDLATWSVETATPTRHANGTMSIISSASFYVQHERYGNSRPKYYGVPSTVDVTLLPGSVVAGKVIVDDADSPPVAATVLMQGIHPTVGTHYAYANEDGEYRIPSVEAGTYNIFASAPGLTCVALDSVRVEKAEQLTGQDIRMSAGAWIEGRVVDAVTLEPITMSAYDRPLSVANYGPSRPRSGAACISCDVDENGYFRLRVTPGVNYPYVMSMEEWQRIEDADEIKEGINVEPGEAVWLEMRMLKEIPKRKQPFLPIRLPLPVEEEQGAAAAIRRLGGWYKLDDDSHVISVNMIYHNRADGERINNDQVETDEALRQMEAFSRLQKVVLTSRQTSDEGLKSLAELSALESLYFYQATELTDEGVAHLANLRNVKHFHADEARVDAGAMRVFSSWPRLETLSLQKNSINNQAFAFLSEPTIKNLWLGLAKQPITDEALPHIGKLTSLEDLDLQQAMVTDVGMNHLAGLINLRKLWVGGVEGAEAPTITDDSIDILLGMQNVEQLHVYKTRLTEEGIRRLAAMPQLRWLAVSSPNVNREFAQELKRDYPTKRFEMYEIKDRD